MATTKIGRWKGGFIGKSSSGTITYYIDKLRDGKPYLKSLKTSDESVAEEIYKRFCENPNDFQINGQVVDQPVLLTERLIEDFMDYSANVKRNSATWQKDQRRYLNWWRAALPAKTNLKALPLVTITQALKKATAERHRVAAFKALYAWLRHEGQLAKEQDPLLDALSLSDYQNRYETVHRVAITEEQLGLVRENMDAQYLDAFIVHATTGWHVTELIRFCQKAPHGKRPAGQILEGGILCVKHKSGDEHKQYVSAQTLQAARRLKSAPELNYSNYREAVNRAAAKAGVPHFTAGAMRHTFVTIARGKGIPKDAVKKAIGHAASSKMIDEIYDQNVGELMPIAI